MKICSLTEWHTYLNFIHRLEFNLIGKISFKEFEWSTNYPAALAKNFRDFFLNHKLLLILLKNTCIKTLFKNSNIFFFISIHSIFF